MTDNASGGPDKPLVHYWNVLRKRRGTVLGFTGALLATTLAASLASTRYYAANAVVEISPKAPVVLDVERVTDLVPQTYGQVQQYYSTQYRILKSRAVLEEAVRRLREEHGFTDFDEMEDPAAFLGTTLEVRPEPDTHLVAVRVEYPDAAKAALIADTIAQSYMDINLSRSLESSRQALQWLQEQQEVYRQRKADSDERVQRYRQAHDLVGPDDQNITLETLTSLQGAWSEVHTQRVRAEAIQAELKRLARAEGWLGLASELARENAVLQDLLGRREAIVQEKAQVESRYGEKHPEMVRVNNEIVGIDAQIRARVDTIVEGQRAGVELVRNEETRLDAEIQKVQEAVGRLGDDMIQLRILTAEAERDDLFFKNLDQRMTEVGLSQFLQANNIRFVDRARPSDGAVRPRIVLNLATALLVGLMGGAALALLIELLDNSIKSREDVEIASGVPLLGVVPRVDPVALAALPSDVDRAIVVNALPRSTVAECLRTIRTNLQFRHGKRPLRRLLVTSAVPREGKSFVSTNLAAIIAMTGSRVLCIDGDLRRPTLHKRLQLPNEVGLADVLAGKVRAADAIQATHVPGLFALVAGSAPENPSELMGANRLQELLDNLDGFDLVLLDSPPVHVVSDALVLAALADGVVFVVESDRTPKHVVQACCARLSAANPNLLGAIVNKLDAKHSGYEYSYDYGEEYRYYLGQDEDLSEPAAS